MPRRRQIVPVDTYLRVIEAYLPDASQRGDGWYRKLLNRTSKSLAPYGLVVGLLVLPDDETALWLISLAHPATARTRPAPELDLSSLIAAATAFAGGHVMERQMDARLVRGEVAEPGRWTGFGSPIAPRRR